MSGRDARARHESERGQALPAIIGVLAFALLGAVALGAIAAGLASRGDRQRAADLAALAAANALRDAHDRVFEPRLVAGRPNPLHLTRAAYLTRGTRAAIAVAARNGAGDISVGFPDGGAAPLRVRVTVRDPIGPAAAPVANTAVAEAELRVVVQAPGDASGAGEYRGPFAVRQGRRMRPDVAAAFDRMAAAARDGGHELVISSAFRSDAEQRALFAAHPDPRWVARPGASLHRLGTELDLGPPGAYGWLAANAGRFGFLKRYAWEPWHFGLARNAGSASVGYGGDGARGAVLAALVPAAFAGAISSAAQRWSVSAALLAAQLHQESGFDPFARSPAGALGIAQFMPATAAAYGLDDPFDPRRAIDAQAHLMRDLLARFADVPLALAAYNAGPAPVARCGCVPAIPETQAYVAAILALLRGAGAETGVGGGLIARLVR